MDDLNCSLMVLAFVLGLMLTFALMIRRVKREAPVSAAVRAGVAGGAGSFTDGKSDAESESSAKKTPSVAAAKSKGGESGSQDKTSKTSTATDAPYGAGSARAGTDGSGPSGWPVKGNEDSMLYRTPDSPSYEQTIAEVWFKDEESAVQGGFSPWHKGKKDNKK